MSRRERTARLKYMRHTVSNENMFQWVDSFLKAGSQLGNPTIREDS